LFGNPSNTAYIIRKSDYLSTGAHVHDPDTRERPADPVREAARQWGERYPDDSGFLGLVSLIRTYSVVVRSVEAVLRPLGLNLSRFEVLLLLSFTRAGRLPSMRLRDLLMVHGSSVTYLVDRLEEAGLIERLSDPGDGRVSLVSLTDEGRTLVDRAAQDLAAAGFGTFGELDEDKRDGLARLLADLRRASPAPSPA
jgi:DNA-binding MarR family transcriptional regulator